MNYRVLGSVWYTPPLPGFDAIDMLATGAPAINVGIVAIASGSDGKRWKCYLGLASGDGGRLDDEQVVATNGVKVSKDVACAHFPQLSPEEFIS